MGKMYAYKMFTFFLHSSSKAFVKSAETALVPFVFINNTLTIKPAQKKKSKTKEKNFVNTMLTVQQYMYKKTVLVRFGQLFVIRTGNCKELNVCGSNSNFTEQFQFLNHSLNDSLLILILT